MAITSGNLSIIGFEQIDEILELEVKQVPNRHPLARFRASIMEGADLGQLKAKTQDNLIKIIGNDNETGVLEKLFSGYIDELKVHDMGNDYYELEVNLIGASCKLDQDKKNRSFQDVSMTHEEVIKKAGSSVRGTTMKWNGAAARKLSMPVIQYYETDWEFILRMASIYGNAIIADETSDYPTLAIGMNKLNFGTSFDNAFYKVGVSKKFYDLGGKKAGFSKSKFMYYRITSTISARVGEIVSFQNKSLIVMEKKACLIESEIKYTYKLSYEEYGAVKTIYNETFIGHTILGKVLETAGETLKLELELSDDEHLNSVAYPYNWTPETGNIMYCMPKAGTKVSLYFSDNDESSGTVVNCIRTNGGTSPKMDNHSNKHFTSEDGLMMDLNLTDLHFATTEDKEGNAFSRYFLDDDIGVTFETKGNIQIAANQSVKFEGKYIFMGASNGEMLLAGSIKTDKATFYLHYQFDGLGKVSSLEGSETKNFPIIKDEPLAGTLPKKKSSGWGLFGKVMAGLAAAAVATAAVCLVCTGVGAGLGVVLGVAAAGMAAGAFAVGTMAWDEAHGGESKSIGQYMLNGGVQAFIGAASAAIGGGLSKIGAKLAVELTGTAISTVAENGILGKDLTDGLGLSLAVSTVTFGLFDTNVSKRIPGLKNLSNVSSDQIDNLGRNASSSIAEASTAKATKEAAGEAAENAARDEAEKAAREEAARRAERRAEQNLNRVRNRNGASTAAKKSARNQLTNAKAARRAAVTNYSAATAAKQSAETAARNAASDAAAKTAARNAAVKSAAKGGSVFFGKQLTYNLTKSGTQTALKSGAEWAGKAGKPYLTGAVEYIESQYSGKEIWAEE
ncbi:type VI secretion system Vgr family protein [Anaeromicropila populeti]|uniref:Phage late control gene D protein (GPD) n=1 Tax=Anaeromicropila populeti TaxID=37658 RepID=A0A1I6K7X3_9FIRM|nr:hypothetical protein [Anaeromicropila populeti]SFR87138.1 hypothetical protein SAMN05661086_02252 [Anaeromicropila populeti]